MAPFTPFITEAVWQDMFAADESDSVHLQSWPQWSDDGIDDQLGAQMALVRRLVELGRGARAEGKVRTRQPLGRALISAPGWAAVDPQLRDHLAAELNVESLVSLTGAGATSEELVHISVKANFRALGRRFGKQTQQVANAIAAADPTGLTLQLRNAGVATVSLGAQEVSIGPDDVIITETPRAGWAVATDAGETIALDLTLTPHLVARGQAREVVRTIQEARKAAGLDITDRILLWLSAPDAALAATLSQFSQDIGREVLAVSVVLGPPPAQSTIGQDEELGLTYGLRPATR
jgi:isoleucyl-tRNA synthetase